MLEQIAADKTAHGPQTERQQTLGALYSGDSHHNLKHEREDNQLLAGLMIVEEGLQHSDDAV